MKMLITILIILLTSPICSQDSIKVKIKKIDGYSITMKTMERPRVKLFTFCKCPYKRKQIVWIKKP